MDSRMKGAKGRNHRAKSSSRNARVRRIILSVLAFVVSFVVTAAALIYFDLAGHVNNLGSPTLPSRSSEPSDSFDGRALNILIIGSDTRVGEGNQVLTGDEDSARSDTTMVMHISQDRSQVNVVSIPRDLIVNIPACERQDGSFSEPQQAQFNWAFSIGGQDGNLASAVFCTWKTVEQLSGIHIDESIVVDFNGFASMIDALGGINVYVPNAVQDEVNSGLVLDPGCHHFDGAQALAYARVRHGVEGSDGSDLQRIERQQSVMSIMMRTAMRKNLLTSMNQLYSFVGNGLANLTMSEGLSSVPRLVGLGWSLQSLQPENLRFVNLPVYPSPYDTNRVMLYEDEAQPIWASFMSDTALPAGTQVRDGSGKIYVISVEEISPEVPAAQPEGEASAGAGEKSAPEGEAIEQVPAEAENDPYAPLTDEQLAQLQRECEING